MIDPIDAEIGERVRTRRAALNISQAGLGSHIGVTFQQVQKYEKGTNRIAAATLLKIAEKLDTSVAILSGEVRPLPHELGVLVDNQSTALLESFNRISPERRKTLLEVAAALAGTTD
ncbi:helix-turn-helix domain-containing protein [Brevundimonas sp.]|jgi:transcriptional regulator with XRE-family HTH domain|uniref:helix-turn-helix domain-containing protein n=1 Tax=Brevundimonas sp. TaxID=1871086 RepID=UPI0037BF8608